jgi:hypothetical protein
MPLRSLLLTKLSFPFARNGLDLQLRLIERLSAGLRDLLTSNSTLAS